MGASSDGIVSPAALAAWALAASLAMIAGCAGDSEPARDLTLSDFRGDPPAPQPASPPESTVVLDQDLGFSPERGPAGSLALVARPGAPQAPDAPEPVAAPVIVDQKVGEINTRPVWAAEFLGPMAARMRQDAEQLAPREWGSQIRTRITEALVQRLRNELIVADAVARIPPAQRQGLSQVLDDIFRRERSAQRGSEAMVERELRAENSTLGEAWERRREELLIEFRKYDWWQQVHVSADEVDLEYHRRFKEFNPDPRAVFRRITVPASDEEAIARIQQRLEDGEPFAEVAADPANRSNAEGGGLVEGVGSFTGEYAEADFWAASASELNEAARSLLPEQWTGPFERGSSVNWLYLERIERKRVSLYEARPQIRRQLEEARVAEIRDADFAEMLSRASFTDIDLMADRLLRIAERWYLEPVLARRGESSGAGEEAGQSR